MSDNAPQFKFIPDWSPAFSVNPRISKVEFGDGYTQRVGKGVNTMLRSVSLTFSGRSDAEAAAILSFFESKGGVEPFTAQIGFNSPIRKYVTEGEWKHTIEYNDHNTITVTFQEVP
jgi:phage-related protein